jgi:hypothetical protein
MTAKKKPLRVPQTSLIDVQDALAVIGSTVEVAVAALDGTGEEAAASMLLHNVSRPLDEQRARIAIVVAHLVRPKRRKKRAPNGSRKGKKRQRNRWKDRQKAKKPWDL